MNDRERRKLETFQRAERFGVEHTDDFGANSLGKQLFIQLSLIINTLAGHASSEESGRGMKRQATSTRAAAREQLRRALEAISRTARAMANEIVGIEEMFRVPKADNDQQLIAFARAIAGVAASFEAQFIAHELPQTFIQDLLDIIADLERAILEQASGRGDHVAARAEIDENIEKGSFLMRKLDAVIKNKYADNPGVRAEWRSASHTERSPRRRRPDTSGPAQGTPSVNA